MKILFLIGMLNFSGAENVLRAIASSLKKAGNEVYISVRVDSGEKGYNGIPIYAYEGNSIQRIVKIRKTIKSKKIDVVVAFGFPFNLDAVALRIFTDVKAVLCERHDPSAIKRTALQKLEKSILYPLADGYIVQTKKTKEYYLSHYTKKENEICVIPNPVRYDKPECVADKERRKEIVTVGRYDNMQKNHIMLINAFQQFHKDFPDYVLKIFGEGDDRKLYEQRIAELGAQEYMMLMGFEKNPIKQIALADIFCLSSNYEGMPNALIEAMSVGLPCVSTKCGGGAAEELIVDGENGLLIDINDEKGLSEAFVRLASDRTINKQIARKAYMINDTLSLESISKEWEVFLRDICKKNSLSGGV